MEHGDADCDVGNVIITGELDRRPSRSPDYEAENRALSALAEAISTDPGTVLQQLVEWTMKLTSSDSAGISLLEPGGEHGIFRWAAIAGALSPNRNGTIARESSPCGEVIAREAVVLVKHPERAFPALLQAEPGIAEGLLAPFHLGGVPVGTLWTIKHSPDGRFEAEDARIIKSLARFASAAHQTVQLLQSAQTSSQQAELRAQQLVTLAEISTEFIGTCDMELMPIYGNAAAMRMVGLTDLEQVKRNPLQAFFFPEDLPFITDEFIPRVLREGQAKVEIRFRHFVTGEPVWVDYSVVVLKDEMGRATGLGTVTYDLTERKRAELALRQSDERRTFLLKLSDAIRGLGDPLEVQAAALGVLGEHLCVNRAFYDEIDEQQDSYVFHRTYANGVAPLTGKFRLSEIPLTAKLAGLGQVVAIDDASADPRLSAAERAAYAGMEAAAFVGVPLNKDGRLIATLGVHQATPRQWTPEDIELIRETAERTWAAVEQVQAEAALRTSEAKYRSLFEAIDSGFCIIEVIFDEAGRASDYRFVETNPTFERQSGLVDAVGRRMREFAPDLEEQWFARFGHVALTGEPMRVESEAAQLGRWFDSNAFRVGTPEQRRVAILFTDITARRVAEDTARANEEHQAFLLRLSDALRVEPSAEAVANRALRMLFEHLRLDRCFMGIYRLEEDIGDLPFQVHNDRLPPLPAQVRLSNFPEALQIASDRTMVIDDVVATGDLSDSDRASFDGIGVRSLIVATLRKGGNIPLWAIVAASSCARVWTQGEISLVEQVAERTWAAVERAQVEAALRESEAKYRTLFNSINQGFYIAEAVEDETGRLIDRRLLEVNPAFETSTGLGRMVGKLMSEFAPSDETKWTDAFNHVVLTGEPRRIEDFNVDTGRWFQADHALIGGPGSRLVGVVFDEITERKRAETALRESAERQAFLLELNDALRAEPSAEALANRALRMLFEHMRLDRCYVGIYRLSEDLADFPHQVHGDHLPPLPAQVHLSDFPEALQIASDRTMVIDDVLESASLSDSDRASFDGISIRSLIVATLRKGGNNPLWAIVAASSCARAWTPGEVALVEEVAERTWAAIERAQAESALRGSEARFREFSDASTNILWIRDAKTMRMEFASPAFDAIYGFAAPDRGGDDRLRSWARLIVPEDRQRVLANFRRVLADERVEQEFRIRRGSDGEIRWVKDVAFPLTDAQGRVERVAGVGQDITAQKQAEAALREREERLGLIVENARDYAIFTIDPGGKITDWREGAEAVFGWSRAEAIGMDAREIFTPEDRENGAFEREMQIAHDKGRAPDVRWHLRKDGSRVFIDGALTRLGDGARTGYLKIGQDVTERHRTDAALSASEGRLQTLMRGIPQLVWRSADNGLCTWVSPQWRDFTGQTLEEGQGVGWVAAIHPDDHEATRLAWEHARSNGLYDTEYRVKRAADGAWIWHHTRAVPVHNQQGQIVEWLGTSTDVQVLKEFQERQAVLVGELQHRTRNLIAIVRSTSDKTARGSTDLTEFSSRFRDRLDALARVQGLLSRLNDLDRVTFDALIKAEMTAMDYDPERVTLDGPSGIRLRSSTVQTLAMALHELATNAVKYGALGQSDARLAVTWHWEPSGDGGDPWLHIDWRETGVNMALAGAAPHGTGQGRELIERALPYQLGAKIKFELGSGGVHCTISLPVSATAAPEEVHD